MRIWEHQLRNGPCVGSTFRTAAKISRGSTDSLVMPHATLQVDPCTKISTCGVSHETIWFRRVRLSGILRLRSGFRLAARTPPGQLNMYYFALET